ncbi:MAG TPA: 3-keto-5-aminohexanoate cleavage protein [Candidatus Baltobacteraceae bacterium]|jgi:uncharacterized protein (DUF849 family)|nr:3-keto-5-aminohexanoate cleavage protein [Candidatus Baltobacteraceae bacterium]
MSDERALFPLPFALALAPTGARRNKTDHPALPMTPDEIVRETALSVEAGATMLHLHVRDREGRHTLDADAYRAAISAIRRELGERVLIQISTEALGRYMPHEQMALVRTLLPEAVSLAIGELVPDESAEQTASDFYHWLSHRGIGVQHILYSGTEVERFSALVQRGVVAYERPHALFVLGRYTTGQQSEPGGVLRFLASWPSEWPWSLCAFGSTEARCMTLAAALGAHARIGFENNLQLPDGTPATSNADLVKNMVKLSACIGRPVADISQARCIYGIERSAS